MKSIADIAHERQQQYVDHLTDVGTGAEMIAAEAFVQSIRKLGYKSAATAADEIIDNAIEAGAENIQVAFGFGPSSDQQPNAIAFLDDGYGMVPGMVAAAARWGGTDRHGSRELFGRFGFGLPSASVSQGREFTVYSRVDGDDFFAVTVDVEGIVKGDYTSTDGRVVMPSAVAGALPIWVAEYADKHFPNGVAAVRTVVIWEKFDVLTWKTVTHLETNLLQHFGLVYRGFLRKVRLVVAGKRVEPIDPLFTTEGYRFFDLDEDRAEAQPSLAMEVKDEGGSISGAVTVRYSYMPPTFLSKDKTKKAQGRNANPRAAIRRENNGLIFTRHGRQIDVVPRSELHMFTTNDRYLGVEIDFPATLDDEFGITTAKQQVTMSPRIIALLKQHNVGPAISQMATRYNEEDKGFQISQAEGQNGARTSEVVMEEVTVILPHKSMGEEQRRAARENLDREIEKVARETDLPAQVVAQQKEQEVESRPFKVELERMVEGPFYRAEQRGGQLVVVINKGHRFFTDVYATLQGHDGLRVRAALELLLFVLGQSEIETTTDGRIWYQSERIDWSRKLNAALTKLEEHIDVMSEVEVEIA
jgi:hypothetical protein